MNAAIPASGSGETGVFTQGRQHRRSQGTGRHPHTAKERRTTRRGIRDQHERIFRGRPEDKGMATQARRLCAIGGRVYLKATGGAGLDGRAGRIGLKHTDADDRPLVEWKFHLHEMR